MAHITNDISKGQRAVYAFGQDAVAATQTDVQLPTVMAEASQAVTGVITPFPGDVVAISWKLTAAGTAGVFTIGATNGGTEDADTTLTVGTAASGYKRIPRGACHFIAGAELGIEITTDGSWDGTSSDLAVWLHTIEYLEGI